MKSARKAGFTIVELTIVVVIFLAMIALLTPVVRLTKAWAHRARCANNERRLSLGLHEYARDNRDRFPEALSELYPRYVEEIEAFDCPASKHIGTPDDPDYVYTAGLTEASRGDIVIIRDKENGHNRSSGNVLTVDGTVELVDQQ